MRLALLVLLLLFPAAHALAQDADLDERRAVATEFVELTTADSVMGPMVDAIWPTLEQQISAGDSSADPKILALLKQAFAAEMMKTMAEVVDDYAALYADAFTLQELQAILAFYRSDAGAKLVTVQPELMNKMLPTLTAKLQVSLPVAMANIMAEAEKQGLKTSR